MDQPRRILDALGGLSHAANITAALSSGGLNPLSLRDGIPAAALPVRVTDALPAAGVHPIGILDALPSNDASLFLNLDIAAGGWGAESGAVFPNLYTDINEAVPNDATFIKKISGQGGTYIGRFINANDPGTLTGFTLYFRCCDTSTGSTVKKVGVTIADANNVTLWDGTNLQQYPDQAFATLVFPVTFGVAPVSWSGLRITIANGLSFPPFDGQSEVSWVKLFIPGGG